MIFSKRDLSVDVRGFIVFLHRKGVKIQEKRAGLKKLFHSCFNYSVAGTQIPTHVLTFQKKCYEGLFERRVSLGRQDSCDRKCCQEFDPRRKTSQS